MEEVAEEVALAAAMAETVDLAAVAGRVGLAILAAPVAVPADLVGEAALRPTGTSAEATLEPEASSQVPQMH
jgi:hypothetical protein